MSKTMIDDEIKKQAREIAREGEMFEIDKQIETKGVSQSYLENMSEDARAWRDAAWETELLRREGTLEENERKYEAAMLQIVANEKGELKEEIIVAQYFWDDDGELHLRMNAFGYDRLPPDVQEAFGKREDVVDQWMIVPEHVTKLEYAFIDYTKNNEGYDSWEEYRDAKGFGKKEEITIEPAQDVADNDKPRETPAVEQSETLGIKIT